MVQIDSDEQYWGGFLVDADAQTAAPLLRGRLARAHDDPDIVEEAWRGCHTIVTSNGADFIRYIGAFQRRENGRDCRDLWGLLIIPNKALVRDRVLPRLYRDGIDMPTGRLMWPAIGYLNLCITVESDGKLQTRRFGRCSHCQRRSPVDLDWYQNLPIAGSKARPELATQ
jgi:hypothetical protein